MSHDRELLNNVCTAVLLIEELQIKYYNVGFKEFEKKSQIHCCALPVCRIAFADLSPAVPPLTALFFPLFLPDFFRGR